MRHGVRGSGAWMQVEVDRQAVERREARLAVARGSPSRDRPGTQPAAGPRHAALRHDRARSRRAAESAGEQPLVVAELAARRAVGARGVEHRHPGVDRGGDRLDRALLVAVRSVDRRMQPRPMRSSDGGFTSRTLRPGPRWEGTLDDAVPSQRLRHRRSARRGSPPVRRRTDRRRPGGGRRAHRRHRSGRPACWPRSSRSSPRSSPGSWTKADGPLELGQADGVACRTVEMFEAFGLAEQADARGVLGQRDGASGGADPQDRPDRPHRPNPGRRGRAVGVPARHREPGPDAGLPAASTCATRPAGWNPTTAWRRSTSTSRTPATTRSPSRCADGGTRGRGRPSAPSYVVGCDGARSACADRSAQSCTATRRTTPGA